MSESKIIVAPLMPTRGHPHYQAEHSLRIASLTAAKAGIEMFHVRHRTSSAVHENRNAMIADLVVDSIHSKMPFTHILFQDDDISIPPDAIVKMVEAGKPIVGALCTTRSNPPIPNARIFHEDSGMWENILEYKHGLQTFGAIGTGLVLLDYEKCIKPMAVVYTDCLYERDILGMPEEKAAVWSKARKEAFNQYPNAWWYRWMPPLDGVGENGEDVFFCWMAKRYLDIQTWVDTTIQPGHMAEVAFSIPDYEARRTEALAQAKAEGRYHPENGTGGTVITPKIFVAMRSAALGEPIDVKPVEQPFVESKKISVLIPTRGRWQMMERAIENLLGKAGDPDSIEILIRHDDDDPPPFEAFAPCVQFIPGPRHGYRHLNLYYNELAEKATGDWLILWNDDALMETEGWDEIIRAQGAGLKVLNATGKLNIFPIVSRELYELLGHCSLQTHSDSWLQVVGRMNGIEYPVDLKIRHQRDEGLRDQTSAETRPIYAESSPEFFSREFQEKLRRDVKKVHKAVERLQRQQLTEKFFRRLKMNYLIGPIYSTEQRDYMEAYELSRRTYRKHLVGPWQEVMITGQYSSHRETGLAEMYADVYHRAEEWTRQGHNVLYAEVDTACVQRVAIFGLSRQMRMFWITCAAPEHGHPEHLNSGIVYFPATMDAKLWDICHRRMVSFNRDIWHEFQLIANDMFWAQEPAPKLHANLNWSPYVRMSIPREKAKILHFHSSRSIDNTLEELRKLA